MAKNRANQRESLIPGTRASRELGRSGPPTARQRANVAKDVATGRMSLLQGLKAQSSKKGTKGV